ncbi:Glycosyltransferase involved in cell wall bisynthesis [Flagellimonas taeanensis]|uniref:Glycosyltransferase involved in cell wall bisynthesis n=1 Tax=Flagellimonas taeanensis TaxID=1005926 RepID=A0A1M6V310_9FLAO|nr:glycosyltransferase family 4 protein [Allomuricauda taeanensis]SFC21158.1 Glycosyltransferase involved in cell wall bisynthesis [Allomuricauda taeanensis]SHK75666.1 Glycosyltransferase involved in cell wall bisynthesis [Allomuricauda taeanensis]
MKTIVILTDQLHKIGGINSLIQLKANHWATKKGYEVHVVTTEQAGNRPFYDFDPKVGLHDLNINYDRAQSYFGKENFPKVAQNLRALQKLERKLKPNLIIIANHIPVTFFFPLLRTKAKILKEYHYTQYFRSKQSITLFKRFEKLIESKLDFQVVLNKEEKSFYDSNKIFHIPNPIPFSSLEQPEFGKREKIAMAAGRISPVKRFHVLLEIWSKFKKNDTQWKLEIYGDGPDNEMESLNDQIRELGIMDSVQILQPVHNLPEIMRTRGIYLMTSEQECFPMVLLEAQASGLPLISFDCPTGPRNIVQSGKNGMLVEMDNQDSFVNTIIKLTSDEDLRLEVAKNAFQSVQQYLLDNVMQSWEDNILSKI